MPVIGFSGTNVELTLLDRGQVALVIQAYDLDHRTGEKRAVRIEDISDWVPTTFGGSYGRLTFLQGDSFAVKSTDGETVFRLLQANIKTRGVDSHLREPDPNDPGEAVVDVD